MKNTDTAGHKGYDAGKKVSGIKRHIAVDTQGLPHAIHVTTADVTDRAGALAMFDRRRDGLSQVQNVLVDGGYTGKPFATAVQGLLGASVEVVKRNELHTFVVLPKRWVVERSFAWLEKCRRLWTTQVADPPGLVSISLMGTSDQGVPVLTSTVYLSTALTCPSGLLQTPLMFEALGCIELLANSSKLQITSSAVNSP